MQQAAELVEAEWKYLWMTGGMMDGWGGKREGEGDREKD